MQNVMCNLPISSLHYFVHLDCSGNDWLNPESCKIYNSFLAYIIMLVGSDLDVK